MSMKTIEENQLDALNAHIQALNEVIASERSKNAALVAALEGIQDVVNAKPAAWRQAEANRMALEAIVKHGGSSR